MKRGLIFAKRNLLEMLRDPIIYLFGLLFPVLMLTLFYVINRNIPGDGNECFKATSLIPGILVFSYTFLMLIMSLLVSKDRKSSFMLRLYSSPMKTGEYLFGYTIPTFIIGLLQTIVCLFYGFILSLISHDSFISFPNLMLLMFEMLPMILICIFLGILFGTILNDNSAPGICSIFISASGVLGGAWMPLDTMTALEKIAFVFPFYPVNYLGRIITGAYHSMPNELGNLVQYSFDTKGLISLIVYCVYFILVLLATTIVFQKQTHSR